LTAYCDNHLIRAGKFICGCATPTAPPICDRKETACEAFEEHLHSPTEYITRDNVRIKLATSLALSRFDFGQHRGDPMASPSPSPVF
jgi:hypothetical protein